MQSSDTKKDKLHQSGMRQDEDGNENNEDEGEDMSLKGNEIKSNSCYLIKLRRKLSLNSLMWVD